MSEKQIDRHVDPPQTSFTFLVPITDMVSVSKIAKREDRTRGSVVREAVKLFLEGRKSR